MCPHYNESQKCCAIFKTTQNSYNDSNYCHEERYSYKDCPNYKQLCQTCGGNLPAPSYYK